MRRSKLFIISWISNEVKNIPQGLGVIVDRMDRMGKVFPFTGGNWEEILQS